MALGTTAVAMLPALAAGSAAHLVGGRSAVRLLPVLCLGTVAGSAAGAWAAQRVDEAWLRGALGVRPAGPPRPPIAASDNGSPPLLRNLVRSDWGDRGAAK